MMATRGGTVYIVEDDASVRRALERLAVSAGLTPQGFATAADFLSSPHDARPACVVLDLRLPDMHGLEVQRRLARLDPDLAVIVVTGYGDEFTRREALRAGALVFLTKPFDEHALLDALRQALAERPAGQGRCANP